MNDLSTMTSYQKLKAKAESREKELLHDIYLLVKKGDTIDGMQVKARYDLRISMEEAVMFGSTYGGVVSIKTKGISAHIE